MVMPMLLSEVVEGLKARPEVEAILLGGSRGKTGTPDRTSDWDLYIYLNAPLDLEFRRELFSPRTTDLDLDRKSPGLRDEGELNDGTVFDLWYRNLEDHSLRIDREIRGEERAPACSTCHWHNFVDSHIVFDRRGTASALQARVSVPYPEFLKKAVTAKNWPLLTKVPSSFRNQAAKAVQRGDWVSAQLLTTGFLAAAFDLLLAANGKTHPGNKNLAARTAALPALPSDWTNLLSSVDRANAGSRANLPGALDNLAAGIETFLVRQGLLESVVKRPPVSNPVRPVLPEAPASVLSAPTSAVLTVYTDGGCIGNPGKGAWAYLVDDGVLRTEDTGGESLTTNNKMELQAVIEALMAINTKAEWKGRPIRIHTDSQYVRNGITTWVKGWEANGWKTASKEPVKNQEFWKELVKWDRALKPEWKWVKGHAGNPNNERCDQLVRRTMDQM